MSRMYAAALAGAGMIVTVTAGLVIAPRSADATPQYAQQTGRSCGGCHVSAAGGGALNSAGKAFAANGHKLPKKK
jgi:mono/diheme cytochrome c family protein